jgi:hypothetical protein
MSINQYDKKVYLINADIYINEMQSNYLLLMIIIIMYLMKMLIHWENHIVMLILIFHIHFDEQNHERDHIEHVKNLIKTIDKE